MPRVSTDGGKRKKVVKEPAPPKAAEKPAPRKWFAVPGEAEWGC